ncbi:MAG: 50S ribosomal protein L11 methyltransferase, partial [Gammaproteobacteria bacterium]|nr:50S ribosomal protein L11 methyltransferase [Gammaproteobacteria bacterium]
MSWVELHITTTAEYVDALNFQLNEWGVKAVTFKDACDQPIYEPTPSTPRIWPTTVIVGLFEQGQPLESLIASLEKEPGITSLQLVSLADEDWVKRSLDQFKPLCFGKRLWICPSWHEPPHSNT